MKKHFLPLMATLLVASACTRTARPLFGHIEVDTLLGPPETRIGVVYDFVTIANADRNPALQTIEQANIDYFFGLDSRPATARDAVDASLAEITADFLPAPGSAIRPFVADYAISASATAETTDTLLTYTIYRESYTGGAHGMYSTEYHTYSLKSGEELAIADLFDEPSRARIRERIREKLAETYADGQEYDSPDSVLEANGFFPADIFVTDNFRVAPEGNISFYYNPYEIACYATGAVEVRFDRDELDRLR
ncbi:MAG: RsiV family protein [Alistipes sp.]|nr:RsiV family protein [Alistipes sp.]